MEKKINILGQDLTIKFNMAVQLSYEQITGKEFLVQELTMTRNRIALYYAAIIANNEDCTLTMDDLLYAPSLDTITQLDNAVSQCMQAWYNIPPTAEPEQPADKEEDDQPKKG